MIIVLFNNKIKKIKKLLKMKRFKVFILLLVVAVIIMCSCNKSICPAYASNDNYEQNNN